MGNGLKAREKEREREGVSENERVREREGMSEREREKEETRRDEGREHVGIGLTGDNRSDH